MNKNGCPRFSRARIAAMAAGPKASLFSGLMLLLALLIPQATPGVEPNANPQDQYLEVFDLIQQGDTLSENGMTNAAMARYRKAREELYEIKRANPNWNPAMITYRLDYLAAKLNPPQPATPPETKTSVSGEEGTGGTSTHATQNRRNGPQVHLLDAGADPRRVLRLHPQAGESQKLDMTLQMTMDMGMGAPMKIPPIEMPMTVTVKSVLPSGGCTYESVMGEPVVSEGSETNAQAAAAMKASFGMLKGLRVTGAMSDRGVNEAVHVTASESVPPQMRQMLNQINESTENLALPLPEEPVGPGAKWEIKMPVKSQGMTIQQTATYELVSVEGDQLHAKCTISQQAANQTVQNPAMPGVKVNLTKLTSEGTGNLTIDLARIFPTGAQLHTHAETAMGVNAGGRMQSMAMKMDVTVRLNGEGTK